MTKTYIVTVILDNESDDTENPGELPTLDTFKEMVSAALNPELDVRGIWVRNLECHGIDVGE